MNRFIMSLVGLCFLLSAAACAMEPSPVLAKQPTAQELAERIAAADKTRCDLEDSLEKAEQDDDRKEIERILTAQDELLASLFKQSMELGYYKPNPYLFVESALAELRPAVLDVRAQVGDAKAALKLGLDFVSRRNDEQAIRYLTQAFSGDIDALIKSAGSDAERAEIADGLNRCGGYLFASDYAAARRLFKYALELGSDDFGALWERGMRSLEAEDDVAAANAVPILREAIAKAPKPLECDLQMRAGIEFFNRRLANVFCRNKAIVFLTEAARQCNMRANDYLVVLHHEAGTNKAALMRAVQHTAPVIKELFLCPRLGCTPSAQMDAKIEKLGLKAAALERIGLCYQRVGAVDCAVRVWQQLPVKNRPCAISYQLANALLASGQPLKALEHVVRVMRNDQENTAGLKDRLTEIVEAQARHRDGAALFVLAECLVNPFAPEFIANAELMDRVLATVEPIVTWAVENKQLKRVKESMFVRAMRVWAAADHTASQVALSRVLDVFWRELDGRKNGAEHAQQLFKNLAAACEKNNLDAIEMVARLKAALVDVPGLDLECAHLCGLLVRGNHRSAAWALAYLEEQQKTDINARWVYTCCMLERARSGDTASLDKALDAIGFTSTINGQGPVRSQKWFNMVLSSNIPEFLQEMTPQFEATDPERAARILYTRALSCVRPGQDQLTGQLLEQAMNLGYKPARVSLARFCLGEGHRVEDGKNYLRQAAAEGDKTAQVWLARLIIDEADFSTGVRLPEVDKALAQLKGLARESVLAKTVYVHVCQTSPVLEYLIRVRGFSSEELYKERLRLINEAAEAGDVQATLDLADVCRLNGDYEKARMFLRRVAERADCPRAYLDLGVLLSTNHGGPIDLRRAHECFVHVAGMGDISGQLELALDFFLGEGVARDVTRGAHALDQAISAIGQLPESECEMARLDAAMVGVLFVFDNAAPPTHAYVHVPATGIPALNDEWARRYFAFDRFVDVGRQHLAQASIGGPVGVRVFKALVRRVEEIAGELANNPAEQRHVLLLRVKLGQAVEVMHRLSTRIVDDVRVYAGK